MSKFEQLLENCTEGLVDWPAATAAMLQRSRVSQVSGAFEQFNG